MTLSEREKEIASKAGPFILICFKAADELRNTLNVDENGYRFVCGSGHFYSRDYYIYGVLDEIPKAGVALLQFQEFLSDDVKRDVNSRMERNSVSSTLDEGWLWIRKLTELFIEVKCFLTTNQKEYFKHYLLIRELEAFRKVNLDFKDFFACENQNVKHSLQGLENEIKNLERRLDVKKCWYLKSTKPNRKRQFSDVRTRLRFILKSCSDLEKLILGFSYEGCYTRPSRGMHANIGGPTYDLSFKEVRTTIHHIGLLAAQLLFNCRKLLKKRSKKLLRDLQSAINDDETHKEILEKAIRPKITKGDLVVAYGDLAEVTGVTKSDFGYRSFKVKYLSPPPLPQIPEDMFPARYVSLFVKRKEIARQVKTEMKRITPNTPINNKGFSTALRQTALDLWENWGFKEYVHGGPDLMRKKVEASLKTRRQNGGSEKI